ncbi:hypothetical protein M2322_000431 [Rhodoblastus acidophilus]|uniref:DUF937 domain-containing protein n=1 Tax=Rhodoblastus acidophilus TaxID=1074 RepID=UPI002224D99A|nr:DUF937 domain-containing protein [Rhodoblastus acidophilus]MCW2314911.1 hypothetical protein [Rhodoblastus acidophilus]
MVDLPSLVQAAHGGEVVGNLAQQFGLSSAQTQAAVDSLTSAVAQGLQNQLQSAQGRDSIIAALNAPTHQQAYADPAAAQSPEVAEAGKGLLERIFGVDGVGQVVNHIVAETGVEAGTLHALASTVAAIVAGGVAKALAEVEPAAAQAAPEAEPEFEPEPEPAPDESLKVKGSNGPGAVVGRLVNPLFNALFGVLAKGEKAAPAAPARAPAPVPAPEPVVAKATPAQADVLDDLLKSCHTPASLQAVLSEVFAKR